MTEPPSIRLNCAHCPQSEDITITEADLPMTIDAKLDSPEIGEWVRDGLKFVCPVCVGQMELASRVEEEIKRRKES